MDHNDCDQLHQLRCAALKKLDFILFHAGSIYRCKILCIGIPATKTLMNSAYHTNSIPLIFSVGIQNNEIEILVWDLLAIDIWKNWTFAILKIFSLKFQEWAMCMKIDFYMAIRVCVITNFGA